MAQALLEVQPLEQGRILNESYTFEDYSKRRAHFLGTYPEYKHLTKRLFQIARGDAETVFQTQIDPALVGAPNLSVQEVRHRELLYEIQPLLPLPTTENTETIDNFAGYGGIEQSEPTAQSGDHPLPSSRLSAASNTMSHPPANYQSPHPQIDTTSHQTDGAGEKLSETVAKASNSQESSTYTTQLANSMPGAYQQTPQQVSTYILYTAQIASSSPFTMSAQFSTQATTPNSPKNDVANNSPQWSSTPAQTAHDPALIRSIIDRLGSGSENTKNVKQQARRERVDSGVGPAPDASTTTGPSSQPSNKVGIRHPISALANRGFHLPVKVPRGKKRPASPESEDDGSTTHSEAVSSFEGGLRRSKQPDRTSPPRKMLIVKLKVPRESLISTTKTQTSRATKTTTSEAPTAVSKIHGGLGKSKEVVNHFEYVIAGTALPSCTEEAKHASAARLNRLRNNDNNAKPRKKNARRSQEQSLPSLDFPPEFFDNRALTDDMNEGVVGCICGSKTGSKTISCEDCFVWQHWECMGSAVPEDKSNGEYRCQMCDPWAHRELIAKLRREQS